MPIKLLVMVKRKPGVTPEAFRDGYENSHARIAVRLFGHLWSEYRRNYLTAGHSFAQGNASGEQSRAADIGYDVVSEIILPDEAALAEMRRIGTENLAMIKEDEAKWFDQAHSWLVGCETVEEDLASFR